MNLEQLFFAAAAPVVEAANPIQELLRQFGWDKRLFFSQLVLFILVALALRKWAYGPILAMLEYRQKQIAEALENAEKTRAELANAQVKAQEIIAGANQQANRMVEE